MREEFEKKAATIREQIQKLQEELKVVEMLLSYLSDHETQNVDEDSLPRPRFGKGGKPTIKMMVLAHLRNEGRGESALDILAGINRKFDQAFVRESLSPQLSRLKDEGLLRYANKIWELTETGMAVAERDALLPKHSLAKENPQLQLGGLPGLVDDEDR